MAELKPFRALRYTAKAGELQTLVCPPYDQIGKEHYDTLLKTNPFHAVRLENPNGDYGGAAALLRSWTEDGILKQDTDPAFYICEQEYVCFGQTQKVKGFLCRVNTGEGILPHAQTSAAEVADRLALLEAASCEFGPVHALYEDDERKTMSRINMLSSGKPRYTFQSGGVTHRLWVINDILVIRAICEDFLNRKLYIADGHHRYAAAGRHGSALMMLTDMEQDFTILPFHCLIRQIENIPQFLENCEPYFHVILRQTTSLHITDEIQRNLDALYRQGKKAFGFYDGGKDWTLLILKDIGLMDGILPDKSEVFRALDCSVLHNLILEKLLGTAARNHTFFTSSAEEAIRSVQSGLNQCALLMNPARLKEVREVADAGELMPPNSTAFYPPFPAGMVMSFPEP